MPWAKKSPELSHGDQAVEEDEQQPDQDVDADRAGHGLDVRLALVDDAERDGGDRRDRQESCEHEHDRLEERPAEHQ